MSKNDMVEFGTQFRGYNKTDVNEYIEKISDRFEKSQNESERHIESLNHEIASQKEEISRMCVAITESDKVIISQKEKITALEKENADILCSFKKMRDELDLIEKNQCNPQEKAKIEEPEEIQTKKETESFEPFSVSSAIKTLKEKIAKFLK